jgi:iron-sulfur cluster repair protein YtfE (RIC family)
MTQDILRPRDVRALVRAQHAGLRSLCGEIDALLARVRHGDAQAERALREHCRALYQCLLRHVAFEDAIISPALRQTDGFGPERADELLHEHEGHRRLLRYAMSSFDEPRASVALLQTLPPLLESLRAGIAREERDLLDADVLPDDAVVAQTVTRPG